MNKNQFGTNITIMLFGESHGPAVGAVLEGIAPGIPLQPGDIAPAMARRRGGAPWATARSEADEVQFLAGVHAGQTTGGAICLVVPNQDTEDAPYREAARLPRPGHADFVAGEKYFGYADLRGGGHFSGRLTAPLVAAGAICQRVLQQHGIGIGAHLAQCGGVADAPLPQEGTALADTLQALREKSFATISEDAAAAMQKEIAAAREAGDSLGGVVQGAVCGLPTGLGEPFFAGVESVLGALLFSIPGVKGVEFGLGFGFAQKHGSEVADAFVLQGDAVRTATNYNGGLNGGVTNGMPVVFRLAVKPTSSIAKPTESLDFATELPAAVATRGRHDPCIAPRVVPVAEAVCALAVLDFLCQRRGTLWQNPHLTP